MMHRHVLGSQRVRSALSWCPWRHKSEEWLGRRQCKLQRQRWRFGKRSSKRSTHSGNCSCFVGAEAAAPLCGRPQAPPRRPVERHVRAHGLDETDRKEFRIARFRLFVGAALREVDEHSAADVEAELAEELEAPAFH